MYANIIIIQYQIKVKIICLLFSISLWTLQLCL